MTFSFFYFLVTYYFLPILIKSIKSKKYFLTHNYELNLNLISNIFEKRKYLMSILFKNFSEVKNLIFGKILNTEGKFNHDPLKNKYKNLINILLTASINSIFYCNDSVLKSLRFFPLLLNKQKVTNKK